MCESTTTVYHHQPSSNFEFRALLLVYCCIKATRIKYYDSSYSILLSVATFSSYYSFYDGAPWHKGVLQGAEKFMASWHKEEEEASRRRATKRDSRDLEPPTHL